MNLQVSSLNGISVIGVLEPRLEAVNAPAFREQILAILEQEQGKLVLDLSGVDFIDSTGIGALLFCHKMLSPRGGLALSGVSDKLMKILRITKLDQGVFRLFADAEEATTAL